MSALKSSSEMPSSACSQGCFKTPAIVIRRAGSTFNIWFNKSFNPALKPKHANSCQNFVCFGTPFVSLSSAALSRRLAKYGKAGFGVGDAMISKILYPGQPYCPYLCLVQSHRGSLSQSLWMASMKKRMQPHDQTSKAPGSCDQESHLRNPNISGGRMIIVPTCLVSVALRSLPSCVIVSCIVLSEIFAVP